MLRVYVISINLWLFVIPFVIFFNLIKLDRYAGLDSFGFFTLYILILTEAALLTQLPRKIMES